MRKSDESPNNQACITAIRCLDFIHSSLHCDKSDLHNVCLYAPNRRQNFRFLKLSRFRIGNRRRYNNKKSNHYHNRYLLLHTILKYNLCASTSSIKTQFQRMTCSTRFALNAIKLKKLNNTHCRIVFEKKKTQQLQLAHFIKFIYATSRKELPTGKFKNFQISGEGLTHSSVMHRHQRSNWGEEKKRETGIGVDVDA